MTRQHPVSDTVPPLVGRLPPQCRRDVDDLRRFTHSAISREAPADPVSPSDFREVLVTGANGFVGRFLLSELLRQNDRLMVHCLIRADSVDHGFERIRAALRQAEVWDEAFASRIRVVVGDIRPARFGLSTADFDVLCRQIDAVYHLAADVTLVAGYAAIRETNAVSIRNVIELCARTRYKHLFYFSSMGIFPEYFCSFSEEFVRKRIEHQMQPDLASMKKKFPISFAGYPWTKLVAEQGLQFAMAAGLPAAIFRLPHTGMSSRGFTLAKNIVNRLFAAATQVEMAPEGFSVLRHGEPVDTLSEICAAISMNPRRRFTIYQCCDSEPPYEEFRSADFGLYWREVPYDSFRRACQAFGESSARAMGRRRPFRADWFSETRPGGRSRCAIGQFERTVPVVAGSFSPIFAWFPVPRAV